MSDSNLIQILTGSASNLTTSNALLVETLDLPSLEPLLNFIQMSYEIVDFMNGSIIIRIGLTKLDAEYFIYKTLQTSRYKRQLNQSTPLISKENGPVSVYLLVEKSSMLTAINEKLKGVIEKRLVFTYYPKPNGTQLIYKYGINYGYNYYFRVKFY